MMRLMAAYWRLTRGATLGAQGVVLTPDNDVLLVRHGYRPGWHFPGGGVEWRETMETALERELFEEAGVVIKGRPLLHGVFAHFTPALPSDHIALFVVRDWERPSIPKPNREIVEAAFFKLNNLPEGTTDGTRRRLSEISRAAAPSAEW